MTTRLYYGPPTSAQSHYAKAPPNQCHVVAFRNCPELRNLGETRVVKTRNALQPQIEAGTSASNPIWQGVTPMKLAALLFLISIAGFAENWSGFLVDGRCWNSRQTNVSQDTTTVSRDMDMDLRYCSPTVHTKHFSVILYDWRGLRLDPKGNTRAAQIVERGNTHRVPYVSVNGKLNRKTIQVTSMSAHTTKPQH